MSPPPLLKPDAAPEATFQPLSASADSCSSPILEPDRSALLQEALADSQLQAVKAQLESRGFGIKAEEAQAVQLAGGQQLLIPFAENAHLVWTRTNGQTAAVGLVRQGKKTLNVSADGQERLVRFLPVQKVEKLLRKLREKPKFQEFEGKLAQKGKRVGKVRVLFDETNKIAILGIASEGSEEKIAHQVRIKLKADKDDEPEDDAEPAIQATACGQVTGEAVPAGARFQAQMYSEGEGAIDTVGSYYDEGRDYEPRLCVSEWGYIYDCRKITPILMISPTSLALPFVILPGQREASFVVWNYGGGTLRGTVTVSAPFQIASGASFSLAPGQPQEVVVRFSPSSSGVFSRSATITSNGGNRAVSLAASALTFEEYLDLMVAAHNAALQQGLERAVYLQDDTKGFALYGFPQISRTQLQALWENFDGLVDGNSLPPWVTQGLALLESISGDQMRQWLWNLVVAERAGGFEEEYNRLLPLGLSTYIQGYQLLTNSNTEQAKAQLHAFVRQLAATSANDIESALTILNQISNVVRILAWQIIRNVPNININAPVWQQIVDDFVRAYEGARNVAYPTNAEKLQFDLDIFKVLDYLANSPNRPDPNFALASLTGLSNILQGLAGYGQPFPFDGAPRTTDERKALIRVAAQAIDNGWRLIGIQRILVIEQGGQIVASYYFPLLLNNLAYQLQIGTIKAVFGIAFFQIGPGFNPTRVLDWVAQAIQGFDRFYSSYLSRRDGHFRMIGAVMVGATSIGQIGGMIDALRNTYGNWDGAIFVVWVDANGRVWFVCIGQGCNLLSFSQQQQEACMLAGRGPDCGAQRWYSGGTQDPSNPVVQITP